MTYRIIKRLSLENEPELTRFADNHRPPRANESSQRHVLLPGALRFRLLRHVLRAHAVCNRTPAPNAGVHWGPVLCRTVTIESASCFVWARRVFAKYLRSFFVCRHDFLTSRMQGSPRGRAKGRGAGPKSMTLISAYRVLGRGATPLFLIMGLREAR